MKKRYIITIAVTLPVLLLWFLFMMSPQMKKKNEIKASVAEAEKRLDDFKRTMREFPGYFNARQRLLQERISLVSKLYSKEDLVKLFDEMEKKSIKHELTLVELSPSVEKLLALNRNMPEENQPRLLDIVVKARGHLKNIGLYIKEIESGAFYKGLNYCRISNPAEYREFSDVSYSFRAILGTIKDI